MIKILTYLISFLVGRYNAMGKPSSLVIIDQILLRARKLLMTSIVSLVAALLLTAGVIISLIEFTRQIDQFAVVWPSAVLVGGLALSFISLGTLIYSFKSKSFDLRYVKNAKERSHDPESAMHQAPRAPSPLEEALGVLVMDFVNERRRDREESQKKQSEMSQGSETQPMKPDTAYENTTLQ